MDFTGQRLHEASVQDIQLELIRRRQFNDFDGERIVTSLLENRDLWLGVYITRFSLGSRKGESENGYPVFSLIPLRDIAFNVWNVDSLVILAESIEKAERIVDIARVDQWRADTQRITTDQEELLSALGGVHPVTMLSWGSGGTKVFCLSSNNSECPLCLYSGSVDSQASGRRRGRTGVLTPTRPGFPSRCKP